ncbi:MAG: hypothetical protein IBX68_11805 [Dehalococcoidia bacterium]|nr:hypothetical protein [Dehalococcoidia bacterium]
MRLMKAFMEDMNRRVKRCSIIDVKLAQGSAMFLALILAKLFPQIMTISIWWFVVLLLLCAIKPVSIFCAKK